MCFRSVQHRGLWVPQTLSMLLGEAKRDRAHSLLSSFMHSFIFCTFVLRFCFSLLLIIKNNNDRFSTVCYVLGQWSRQMVPRQRTRAAGIKDGHLELQVLVLILENLLHLFILQIFIECFPWNYILHILWVNITNMNVRLERVWA